MDNMIVLPAHDERFRLSEVIAEVLPDFRKAQSWSIRGQYTHPDYENDWVYGIRVELRRLSNAGHAFLQGIYREQLVHREALVIHICDLLRGDLERGDEATLDFEDTVEKLRAYVVERFGWADVRPSSNLSVNRDGFGVGYKQELPEMREISMSSRGPGASTDGST